MIKANVIAIRRDIPFKLNQTDVYVSYKNTWNNILYWEKNECHSKWIKMLVVPANDRKNPRSNDHFPHCRGTERAWNRAS